MNLKSCVLSQKRIRLIGAVIFYGTFTSMMYCQKSISLQEAHTKAISNNREIRSSNLKNAYFEAQENSVSAFSPTAVMAEFGQFNSFYADKKIGLNQSVVLPQVISRTKKFYRLESSVSKAESKLKELDILRALEIIENSFFIAQKKETFISDYQKLTQNLVSKADARLKKGETSSNELIVATQLNDHYINLLNEIQLNKSTLLVDWNYLINDSIFWQPDVNVNIVSKLKNASDTFLVQNHPAMVLWNARTETAFAQTQLEKVKLWPEFQGGVYAASIQGTGADDKVYDGKIRFLTFQAGLQIPLHRKSIHSRINMSRLNEKWILSESDRELQELWQTYKKCILKISQLKDQMERMESLSLQNALTLRSNALLQFEKGEINYLDYVLLLQQSIELEINYLNVLDDILYWNTELKFLTQTKF